jgi:hypothetical protein
MSRRKRVGSRGERVVGALPDPLYTCSVRLLRALPILFATACSSNSSQIPSAPVYACNPEPADAGVGCRAVSPNDSNLYPEGCMVTLPVMAVVSPPAPVQCTCRVGLMHSPDGGFQSGLEFLCPD